MKYIEYYHSPIGWLKVEADEAFVLSVQLVEATAQMQNNANPITRQTVKELQQYFAYPPVTFSMPLNPNHTAFARDIYQTLQKTEVGEVLSYSELAIKSGHPNAARAVGNALNKNPFMIIVPCHRVIHHDLSLGGFALDLSIKKQLLEHEAKYRK